METTGKSLPGAERRPPMDCLINIDVPDLEAAIAFYEQGVGLCRGRRLFAGTVAEMLGAAPTIYLIVKAAGTLPAPGSAQVRDYRRHWTPVHVDFVVADVEAAVRRAVAAGGTLETPPTAFAWGRLAEISDPFGNGLCFVQWSGAGYGEVDRQPGS